MHRETSVASEMELNTEVEPHWVPFFGHEPVFRHGKTRAKGLSRSSSKLEQSLVDCALAPLHTTRSRVLFLGLLCWQNRQSRPRQSKCIRVGSQPRAAAFEAVAGRHLNVQRIEKLDVHRRLWRVITRSKTDHEFRWRLASTTLIGRCSRTREDLEPLGRNLDAQSVNTKK